MLAMLLSRYLPVILGRPAIPGARWGSPALLIDQLKARMDAVPDLAWLMGVAVVIALVLLMRDFHRYNKGGPSVDQATECQSRGICILVPVVFTLAVIMGAYSNTLLLPRYLVPVDLEPGAERLVDMEGPSVLGIGSPWGS